MCARSAPDRPEKILQFGEGNFLRAFVDWMVDVMNERTDFNGSVVVVQPIASGMVAALNEQQCRYTLWLQGLHAGRAVRQHRRIESISRGIDPYQDFAAFLATARQPAIRFVVSNTTEAGIATSPHDAPHHQPPATFPAKVAVWLRHRYQALGDTADAGVIFLPCELINHNGDRLREAVAYYADRWGWEKPFVRWLNHHCTFCNTLVDRIVPGFPRRQVAEMEAELGYADPLMVEAEPFHLWVIEGPETLETLFPARRAGLNVQFVTDLQPYRTRKVRILNGAHTALVPPAYLAGLRTVRDAVTHETWGPFVRGAIDEEIIPTLNLPADALRRFADDVLERFANPYVDHALISIALNATSKYETRVLPSLLAYQRQTGHLPARLTFALAALVVMYRGEAGGEPIALQDDADVLAFFRAEWDAVDGPAAGLHRLATRVLAHARIWKQDLNQVAGLTDALAGHLTAIVAQGTTAALALLPTPRRGDPS